MDTQTTFDLRAFEYSVSLLIREGEVLQKRSAENEIELQEFTKVSHDWEGKCIAMLCQNLREEFSKEFIRSFKKRGNVFIPAHVQPIQVKAKKLSDDALFGVYALKEIASLIRVSDVLVNPERITEEKRSDFSISRKRLFILEKLNCFIDDELHDLKFIFGANGILSSEKELVDNIQELETQGYVETQGITMYRTCAAITTRGRELLEESSRPSSDVEVNDEVEILKDRLDEIMDLLRRNNDGNEIIFDELQEMKEAKLNAKNWQQLLKGKLIDLMRNKAAAFSAEAAKDCFNHVTKDFNLPKLFE